MNTEKQHFTIRASASRLDKGLLAVPQKFKDWFPGEKGQIEIVFDDEQRSRTVTFHPYDRTVKESRIFGLRNWFTKRHVREGDLISITIENVGRLYRIVLDRYLRERQEEHARQMLKDAESDSQADRELSTLVRLTKKRPRQLAQQELLRIVQELTRRPRPRVSAASTLHHESTPSGIRVLLRELHGGKCQLCSFTFEKRNGEPYFEVHHLDPEIGHHPSNLLLVCPNCHAQLEHATVADFIWAGGWLVGVTINGRRTSVRQPFVDDSARRALLSALLMVGAAAIQMGRVLGPIGLRLRL